MKEIGGYIELDQYSQPMLHQDALALNCGRNCLAYLIQARKIRRIALPYFLCDSVVDICKKEQIEISFYHIGEDFLPLGIVLQNTNNGEGAGFNSFSLSDNQWLYLVNYYGQLTNIQLEEIVRKYPRIIIDQAQAYYQMPLKRVDTLYTCRKFFGVSDGAFLYTDAHMTEELPLDESFDRMHFLLGRFEREAGEFYEEYSRNNRMFESEPIKKMSKLTKNLLHGIDYEFVKQRRTKNYRFLERQFLKLNELRLRGVEGAYMYPLYIKNGLEIRKKLQEKKVYIPTLWPGVLKRCAQVDLEYDMALNILPLPVDQRYKETEMQYLTEAVMECIN